MRQAMVFLSLMLASIFSTSVISAQVLTTPQTVGKGKQALGFTENRATTEGASSHAPYIVGVWGLSSNLDLYVEAGDTHAIGQDQAFGGVGGNLHLLKIKKFDFSLYGIVTTGFHRRSEASTVFADGALLGGYQINANWAFYTGLNTFAPIGATNNKLFTPGNYKVNAPLGVSWSIPKSKWGIIAEVDVGPHSRATGISISKLF